MATTHYSELKAFAAQTEGVENASVEFDVETLSPTYRLSIGLPGRSNALAIAARLGLPAAIIEGSQAFISAEEQRVETMLAEIARDREAAAELYVAAAAAQREAQELAARLQREAQTLLREREQIVQAARAEARASVDDLKRELDRAEAELRLSGSAPQAAVAGVRARLEHAATQAPLLARPPAPPEVERERPLNEAERAGGPAIGDRVALARTGQEGTVTALPNARGEIEVQIGPFKTRVKAAETRFVAPAAAAEPEPRGATTTRLDRIAVPAPSLEFDLRGWRVDEVAPELERYLNDAFLANLPFVRIIHGKGTGALRQVVREELATNPLVREFRAAEARDGGEGVTIAHLAV